MKITIALICILIQFSSFNNLQAQNKYVGVYHSYYQGKLKINADSTFNYSWNFDLESSWTNGTWKIINDTIYFKAVLIYDTLRYTDKKTNVLIDTLTLSDNETSKLLTSINNLVLQEISSGGQNRVAISDKLYYKKDKLFQIEKKNGKLIKKKVRGFGTKKKYQPYYIREK